MPAGNRRYRASLIGAVVGAIVMATVLAGGFSQKEWDVPIKREWGVPNLPELSRSDLREIQRLVDHRLLSKHFSWRRLFPAANLRATLAAIRAERVESITVLRNEHVSVSTSIRSPGMAPGFHTGTTYELGRGPRGWQIVNESFWFARGCSG